MKILIALLSGLVITTSALADDTIEAKYTQYCALCHAQGLLKAPKLGDKDAWAPRLAQGKNVLLEHTKNGFNKMPAKGTCDECSDEELAKLIDKISH